jgi:hypothetical protein
MKWLRQLGNRLLLAGIACSMLTTQVLAQASSTNEQPTNEEGLSTRWALAYGLVGLGVVLGLLNVCRPGKRKGDTPKPG